MKTICLKFMYYSVCAFGVVLCATFSSGSASADLPLPAEEFLRDCAKVYCNSPNRMTPEEWKAHAKVVIEHLDDALSLYLRTTLNKRFYDNVTLLLFQDHHIPLVDRPTMMLPVMGAFMANQEAAARYPMAERMAFMKLVLSTSDPFDRGAYHVVAKGKQKQLGPLREWVKAQGKLDDPLSQEAVRVLAEVDVSTFLKEVCAANMPYQADTPKAAEQQRELAETELQSADRIQQLAGFSRLIRLGVDKPEMDLETLWKKGSLHASPIGKWERDNQKYRIEMQKYACTGEMTMERLHTTEVPARILVDLFQSDAWFTLLSQSNVSPADLMHALLLEVDESASQVGYAISAVLGNARTRAACTCTTLSCQDSKLSPNRMSLRNI